MFEPVEGRDYIFDRYSFLGISKTSSQSDIRQAIKEKKSGLHPDRLVKLDDLLSDEAKRQWELTEQCEMLLNPEAKAVFDEKLNWFEQNYPDFISTSGQAIISLDDDRIKVNLDAMINGEKADISLEIRELELRSPIMRSSSFQRLQREFQQNPQDEDVRQDYRDELKRRLTRITLEEDLVWKSAGIDGHYHNQPEFIEIRDYLEAAKEQLDEVPETLIAPDIEERGLLLSAGMSVPLLPASKQSSTQQSDALANTAHGQILSEADKQQMLKTATKHFNQSKPRLEQLAAQRQDIMNQLMESAKRYELQSEITNTGLTEIFLLDTKHNQPTVMCSLIFSEQNGDIQVVKVNMEHKGQTLEDLQKKPLPHESYGIEYEQELNKQLAGQAVYCYYAFKYPEQNISQQMAI